MKNTLKALQLKTELDLLRPINKEQEDRIMQKFRLDWNYHSNHLEGNTLTYGETKALILHGITAQGKTLKDHFEITGHNEAINWVVEMVAGERPLTENFIRELHTLLLKESYEVDAQTADGKPTKKRIAVGSYKTTANHVLTKTGEMFYFATPEETPAKMHDLLVWYENKCLENDVNPIVLAAQFHYKFIRIHPFDDGNGRTARILMNFILMKYGFPPCIIKSDKDSKDDYFSVLQLADAGNIEAFIEFIAQNVNRSLVIMIAGANGENIEEDDDLDKEIALLEQRLKVIEKNKEVTEESIKNSINNSFVKFSKEFFDAKINLDKFYNIKIKRIGLKGNLFEEQEEHFLNYFNAIIARKEIIENSYAECLIIYKDFINDNFFPFEYPSSVKFYFLKNSYYLINDLGEKLLEKNYPDQLSDKEIQRIIKSEVKRHKEFIEQKIAEKENTNL